MHTATTADEDVGAERHLSGDVRCDGLQTCWTAQGSQIGQSRLEPTDALDRFSRRDQGAQPRNPARRTAGSTICPGIFRENTSAKRYNTSASRLRQAVEPPTWRDKLPFALQGSVMHRESDTISAHGSPRPFSDFAFKCFPRRPDPRQQQQRSARMESLFFPRSRVRMQRQRQTQCALWVLLRPGRTRGHKCDGAAGDSSCCCSSNTSATIYAGQPFAPIINEPTSSVVAGRWWIGHHIGSQGYRRHILPQGQGVYRG